MYPLLTLRVHPPLPHYVPMIAYDVIWCNDSPAELLNKDAIFSIKIVSAKGLPIAYANDPYVTFTFWDQHFETEAIDGKTVVPIWECEKRYAHSLPTHSIIHSLTHPNTYDHAMISMVVYLYNKNGGAGILFE
jgi:hypothetical protein